MNTKVPSFPYYRSCILIFAFASCVCAQQNSVNEKQAAPSEIETLRLAYTEQKREIEELRGKLNAESDLRQKQQAQLNSLASRVDDLRVAVERTAPASNVAIVPAVLTVSAPGPTPVPAPSDAPGAGNQQKTVGVVETASGKVKFSGLIQAWYVGGNRDSNNTFRIRRAQIGFSGQINPHVGWNVMFDVAKVLALNTTTTTVGGQTVVRDVSVNQAGRALQDVFINVDYFKHAAFVFGQFKVPLSLEGVQNTATIETVDRALFLSDRARGGSLGDVRDIGLMAFGPLGRQVDYQLGIFNGSGESQNDVDRNDQKAIAGRLVLHPTFLKGLQFGGSGVWGNKVRMANPRRDRLGAELQYQNTVFKLKSELMTAVDGDVHRRGFYVLTAYRFRPKVEGVARFDEFDPDIRRNTTAANTEERDYLGGFNYYIKGNNLKLQFDYVRKTFVNRLQPNRNVFLVNLQTAW